MDADVGFVALIAVGGTGLIGTVVTVVWNQAQRNYGRDLERRRYRRHQRDGDPFEDIRRPANWEELVSHTFSQLGSLSPSDEEGEPEGGRGRGDEASQAEPARGVPRWSRRSLIALKGPSGGPTGTESGSNDS